MHICYAPLCPLCELLNYIIFVTPVALCLSLLKASLKGFNATNVSNYLAIPQKDQNTHHAGSTPH